MRCPICHEEVASVEQAERWGPEWAHSRCVTAYNYGKADATPETPAQPAKIPIPPAGADALDVVYAEGWNAACDAFFGGKPAAEPLVITVQATSTEAPAQASAVDERETVKACLVAGGCKHAPWCSDVYCQEHCRFVKGLDALDALAELCDEATGGWDLPPSAVQRIGSLARKARAALAQKGGAA